MRRRAFLYGSMAVVAAPVGAKAQEGKAPGRVYRVGLPIGGTPNRMPPLEGLKEGLRELGYVDGQNVMVVIRAADGDYAQVPELAAELIALKPDVVMTNVTQGVRALTAIVFALGVRAPSDVPSALGEMARSNSDALLVVPDGMTFAVRRTVIDFAERNRLPAMYTFREEATDGGLMAYGPNLRDLYRRTAFYIDRLLKGTKSADLPVEQPTKCELVINLRTAKALGLTLPPSLLARADQVIE